MNPVLKDALIDSACKIAITVSVTTFAFITVKGLSKIYGPIEVKIKS